jgi:pyruvate ferredoxin oxidoreductase gamma subunit/2-oxoisovalerate ferredoxin oxidoreductase gamma subunit
MLEIRFHGRGGQGAVLASILMSKAFFQAGYYVQSFPFFGIERRGAPIEAYLRISHSKIFIRTNVYTPDHIIVLDNTLLGSIDITRGLKPGGIILINATKDLKELSQFPGYRIAVVDATQIALRNHIGSRTNPIVNTSLMGAMSKILEIPPMDAVEKAIMEETPAKQHENVKAAKEAFDAVEFYE